MEEFYSRHERLHDLADAEASWQSRDDLIRLTSSPDPNRRLLGLILMFEQIDEGISSEEYIEIARQLVGDPDNDCRWKALSVIGKFAERAPEAVWGVVSEFGESEDEDMRDGVACVLLEHLLEYHFDLVFPRLKERIEGGARLLADTLGRCYAFGQAKDRWREVETLLRDSRGGNS